MPHPWGTLNWDRDDISRWNFRWFADSRTDVIRPAKAQNRRAHEELHAYGEHQQERGVNYETPEYYRLNRIAWDARQHLRKVRGW